VASVAGRAVTTLIGLVTVPIVIGYLGKERYGLWAAINSLVPWFGLFDLGVVAGIMNALSEAHGRDDREVARGYFSTAFFLLLGVQALLGAGLVLVFPFVPWASALGVPSSVPGAEVAWSLGIAAVFVVGGLPLGLVWQAYAAYQRSYVVMVFATLSAIGSLLILLLVARTDGGLPAVVAASTGTTTAVGFGFLAWLFFRDMPWLRPGWRHVSRSALRRLRASAVPLYAFQLGALLVNQSQQLVLVRRAGLATVAEYDLLLRFYALGTSLITLGTASFLPAIREAHERGDGEWMRRTFWRLVGLRMLLGLGACALLLAGGNAALRIWLHRADFQFGLATWAALCALLLAAIWASAFLELMMVMDRIWPMIAVVLAQGALTFGLTWVLGPRFGVIGALLAISLPALGLSAWIAPAMARSLLRDRGGGNPSSPARGSER
jgi:O-antigen/teichoic acid export membrane protein